MARGQGSGAREMSILTATANDALRDATPAPFGLIEMTIRRVAHHLVGRSTRIW